MRRKGENPLKQTIFGAATLLLAGALSVLAQSGTGTISGTVTDAQDAIIAGAEITIRNTATNAVFRTASNESGNFTSPGMPVAEYEVTGQRPGFKRAVRSGITLQVNQNAQVNLRLEIGAVAESVEVVAEA